MSDKSTLWTPDSPRPNIQGVSGLEVSRIRLAKERFKEQLMKSGWSERKAELKAREVATRFAIKRATGQATF